MKTKIENQNQILNLVMQNAQADNDRFVHFDSRQLHMTMLSCLQSKDGNQNEKEVILIYLESMIQDYKIQIEGEMWNVLFIWNY